VSKSPSFDSERAYQHTRALCYPRRVGTPRERRAARYIWRQFTALGLACEREPFQVSHFPAEIGNRIAFVLAALLVLGAVLLLAVEPLLAVVCWSAALFAVNAPWRLSKLFGTRWPPCTTSHNVLATLPKKPIEAPARIVFMAHYDTKSQLFPTGVRVALVACVTVLCGAGVALGILTTLGVDAASPAVCWSLETTAVVLLAALALNVTGNRSPGALDNGSAVGTLLELARGWRPRPELPVEVYWVASGSEEVDLDGARHFLSRRETWWQDKPTLLINLESVGAGQCVYLAGEPQSLHLARETADELGVPHGRLRVVGAGMDHEPFAARGLTALSILGDVVRASLALHTSRDDMRLIDRAALDRAGRLAAHLAWRWAEMHAPRLWPRLG
jgi:hypothetical protein